MIVMLQLEVAKRIAGHDKFGGYLTVIIGIYCASEILFTVKPSSFKPKPKINSAVMKLTPYKIRKIIGKLLLLNPNLAKKIINMFFICIQCQECQKSQKLQKCQENLYEEVRANLKDHVTVRNPLKEQNPPMSQ